MERQVRTVVVNSVNEKLDTIKIVTIGFIKETTDPNLEY